MYCVIMAGGSGTRFWPLSRERRPKQFLSIHEKDSLIQSTIKRFHDLIGWDHIYIAAKESQKSVLENHLLKVPVQNVIYEPVGKNTAPCVGLAALFVHEHDKSGVMIISPADHLVKQKAIFKKAILTGHKIAKEKGGLVTIGIKPTRPSTGYGYIQVNDEVPTELGTPAYTVKTFAEKPNLETAERFLESGDFYWNSGIFILRVDSYLNALEEHLPDLYDGLMEIRRYLHKPQFTDVMDRVYRQIKSISIDYGVMEKANNVYAVRGDFEWNDLGSWEEIYKLSKQDDKGNAMRGDAILLDTSDSYVQSSDGIVAVVGLDNVVVVRDGNATLVCARDRVEDVKKVVEKLRNKKRKQYL